MPFDWKEIKNEFKGLRDLLETIPSAPSEQQVEAHMVMKKLEKPSVLDIQFSWNYHACCSVETRKRWRELKADIERGGASECPSSEHLAQMAA